MPVLCVCTFVCVCVYVCVGVCYEFFFFWLLLFLLAGFCNREMRNCSSLTRNYHETHSGFEVRRMWRRWWILIGKELSRNSGYFIFRLIRFTFFLFILLKVVHFLLHLAPSIWFLSFAYGPLKGNEMIRSEFRKEEFHRTTGAVGWPIASDVIVVTRLVFPMQFPAEITHIKLTQSFLRLSANVTSHVINLGILI